MEKIGIKQATKKGYIECRIPGVADFSYPESKLRRGRVQRGGYSKPHNNNKWNGMQDNQMAKKVVVIGRMNSQKDRTFEMINRVYDRHSCCPTLTTCGGVTQNQR